MTYSGNILVPRWNHVAVFHETERKLIIHGGKDDQDRYLCSVVEINVGMFLNFVVLFLPQPISSFLIYLIIFLDSDLFETDIEEISIMASRREIEEERKAREIISDLQNQVEELRYPIVSLLIVIIMNTNALL